VRAWHPDLPTTSHRSIFESDLIFGRPLPAASHLRALDQLASFAAGGAWFAALRCGISHNRREPE
jgi:hypothetical protein